MKQKKLLLNISGASLWLPVKSDEFLSKKTK